MSDDTVSRSDCIKLEPATIPRRPDECGWCGEPIDLADPCHLWVSIQEPVDTCEHGRFRAHVIGYWAEAVGADRIRILGREDIVEVHEGCKLCNPDDDGVY